MAHIFKHPSGSEKGIVVFSHKELSFLENNFRFSHFPVSSPGVAVKNLISFISSFSFNRKALELIGENYFIGVHWGFFSRNVVTPKWVDFHMAAKGTCTFLGDPLVIPLSSANFTPSIMHPTQVPKYWDLLCVAKNDKKKNLDILMSQIRKIYDLGYKYRVLFVVASNKIEPNGEYYSGLLKDYFENFSQDERELFTIIKTHPELGFQGFSYSFLSHIYNQSKVFTIFSQREGECRVIKEAQLCGLPVVVKNDMEGGGRDFLNGENSLFFSDYDTAHLALIHAVENYKSFNVDFDELKEHVGEEASLSLLKSYFDELYKNNNQVFDGELINDDNLNRRLPSHFFDSSINWAYSAEYRFKTGDIVNRRMLRKFCENLSLSEKIT